MAKKKSTELDAQGSVQEIDDDDFRPEVLESDIPVLVIFSAEGCSYCSKMKPILGRLAQKFSGRVRFVQLEYGESPVAIAHYKIQTLPTLVMILDGEEIGKNPGFMKERELVSAIESVLAAAEEDE